MLTNGDIRSYPDRDLRGYSLPHQKQIQRRKRYVRFGSKADILRCGSDVRFTPESGHLPRTSRCPLSAKSGIDYLVCQSKE